MVLRPLSDGALVGIQEGQRAVFCGLSYFPMWECENPYLKDLGCAIELDPIDYKNPAREPSPRGRVSQLPVNFGVKYKLLEMADFS